jgi:hypothetical protein
MGRAGFHPRRLLFHRLEVASQPEAEAKVAKQCAEFGRGGCKVMSFSGQECAALATFIGSYARRPAGNYPSRPGGSTFPEAQSAALNRCNADDERTRGRCQFRTAVLAMMRPGMRSARHLHRWAQALGGILHRGGHDLSRGTASRHEPLQFRRPQPRPLPVPHRRVRGWAVMTV